MYEDLFVICLHLNSENSSNFLCLGYANVALLSCEVDFQHELSVQICVAVLVFSRPSVKQYEFGSKCG